MADARGDIESLLDFWEPCRRSKTPETGAEESDMSVIRSELKILRQHVANNTKNIESLTERMEEMGHGFSRVVKLLEAMERIVIPVSEDKEVRPQTVPNDATEDMGGPLINVGGRQISRNSSKNPWYSTPVVGRQVDNVNVDRETLDSYDQSNDRNFPINWSGSHARPILASNNGAKISLLRFDGTDRMSLDDYLNHFRICSELYHWSEHQCCLILCGQLEGHALTWLNDVPLGDRLNWPILIEHLRKRCSPEGKETYYRSLFMNRKKLPNETPAEYARELRKLVNKAYGNMTIEAREEFLKERFGNSFPCEMRMHLAVAKASNLDTMVELAETFESIRAADALRKPVVVAPAQFKSNVAPRTESNHGSNGVENLTRAMADFKGEMTSALADLSRSFKEMTVNLTSSLNRNKGKNVTMGSNRNERFTGTCYRCGKRGHKRANCRLTVEVNAPGNRSRPNSPGPDLNEERRS